MMRILTRLVTVVIAVPSTVTSFTLHRHRHQSIVRQHDTSNNLHSSSTDYLSQLGIPMEESSSRKTTAETAFGDLHRISMPGEQDGVSSVGSVGVPTFAAVFTNSSNPGSFLDPTIPTSARGLEGAINQGPAFVLDHILSKEICEQLISDCEMVGFADFNSGKNNHGAMQILVPSELADLIGQRISRFVDVSKVEERRREMLTGCGLAVDQEDVRLVYAGLNRRWRIYRYDSDGVKTFASHIDAGFPPSGLSESGQELVWDASDPGGDEIVSRLTVLFYLNDDFIGGETNFFEPRQGAAPILRTTHDSKIASVRPVAGSCLIFPQAVGIEATAYAREYWPLHEGSPVTSGRPKYVIRSDVLFAEQKEPLLLGDRLFCYDHLVREAFRTRSQVMDRCFLSHAASLYNPHMGVENLGPLLYSFIRFTKKRNIVEIGAGYTSLWILQALQDNDDEFERIRNLQNKGKNRLLDIEWTIPSMMETYQSGSSSLLCIDNCAHQKETATGTIAVAKSLGLEKYLEFVQRDAFELELDTASVDILWCDFGVGSRIKEFVFSAWGCIRPGGFLICHSTLTNQNTREWLECIRAREGEAKTGIPPNDYVEVSLLEPMKRFQNSISILQKRADSTGTIYDEPVYSMYA
jgi:hypothetical protein